MGTTIAVGAATLLLLLAAYLAWTRRLERIRNAELQIKLVMREAELVARRVQVEHLAGKEVIPRPSRPKRERPHYLKPLAVAAGGAATLAAWLRNNVAATMAVAGAGAVLMLTPSVAPPPSPSPPPIAEPNQGAVPPTRQEFPDGRPATSEPEASDPSDAPDPSRVPPPLETSTPAPEQAVPVEPAPTEQAPGGERERQPENPPEEDPSGPPEEPPPPPCIVVKIPPDVNPESCLDILT